MSTFFNKMDDDDVTELNVAQPLKNATTIQQFLVKVKSSSTAPVCKQCPIELFDNNDKFNTFVMKMYNDKILTESQRIVNVKTGLNKMADAAERQKKKDEQEAEREKQSIADVRDRQKLLHEQKKTSTPSSSKNETTPIKSSTKRPATSNSSSSSTPSQSQQDKKNTTILDKINGIVTGNVQHMTYTY